MVHTPTARVLEKHPQGIPLFSRVAFYPRGGQRVRSGWEMYDLIIKRDLKYIEQHYRLRLPSSCVTVDMILAVSESRLII